MIKTNNLARGAVLTALSIIGLYIGTYSPLGEISILGIVALIIPIAMLWTDTKTSFLVYITTSLLGIMLLGFQTSVLGYILFFGTYGFAKFFIEKLNSLPLEIIAKVMYFTTVIIILYLIVGKTLIDFSSLKFDLPLPLLALASNIVFLIVDYVFSLLIQEIQTKYLRHLK